MIELTQDIALLYCTGLALLQCSCVGAYRIALGALIEQGRFASAMEIKSHPSKFQRAVDDWVQNMVL